MFKKFGPHKVVVGPYLVDRTLLLLLLLIFTFCFSSFSQEYLSTDAELNGADVYIPVSSAVFVCWCVFVCECFFLLFNEWKASVKPKDWRRVNARSVSFRNSLRRPIYIISSVDKTELSSKQLIRMERLNNLIKRQVLLTNLQRNWNHLEGRFSSQTVEVWRLLQIRGVHDRWCVIALAKESSVAWHHIIHHVHCCVTGSLSSASPSNNAWNEGHW